jgi:hypothetical protein
MTTIRKVLLILSLSIGCIASANSQNWQLGEMSNTQRQIWADSINKGLYSLPEQSFETWRKNWDEEPHTKIWFNELRSEIDKIPDDTSVDGMILKRAFSNLPGYLRTPTNLETSNLRIILQNNALSDRQAWDGVGTYLSDQTIEMRPFWAPNQFDFGQVEANYQSNAPEYIASYGQFGDAPKIATLEARVTKLDSQIDLLVEAVKTLAKKIDELEPKKEP